MSGLTSSRLITPLVYGCDRACLVDRLKSNHAKESPSLIRDPPSVSLDAHADHRHDTIQRLQCWIGILRFVDRTRTFMQVKYTP